MNNSIATSSTSASALVPVHSSKSNGAKMTRPRDSAGGPLPKELCEPPAVVIAKHALLRDCLIRCLAEAFPSQAPTLSFATIGSCNEAAPRDVSLFLLILGSDGHEFKLPDPDLLAELHKYDVPIVVVSDDATPCQIVDMMGIGISGYLSTSFSMDVMVAALRLILAGGRFVPAESLIESMRSAKPRTAEPPQWNSMFTSRQFAVIEALRRGKANKIIAYELNMCESTVKVHVRNIMKRLQAKNRTEVAFKANGLLASLGKAQPSPPNS